MAERDWLDDYYVEDEEELQIDEYDITASPNDFNVITLYNFIESGAIKIPAFQRNYVWEKGRASRLIESLILGLPVPQLFLYEESRNRFLVIDGQQRLLSIYYFIKQRFPRKEKRVELRHIFDNYGKIPDEILADDAYFTNFKLDFPGGLPTSNNRFKGLNYESLGDNKTQFELRPIRNIIVKQNSPKDDDSSIYEIFNRLNTGGMNLNAQEIRASLYHSDFYDMLNRINEFPEWRRIIGKKEPDHRLKDLEILTRCFAMLIHGESYKNPLISFLNQFSKECKNNEHELNKYLEDLFKSFISACGNLPQEAFIKKNVKKFNVALFEGAFTAYCKGPLMNKEMVHQSVDYERLETLANDPDFKMASSYYTTTVNNVIKRLERARDILTPAQG